jgi:5,10-methylenetetrahydromethanopterin reductase
MDYGINLATAADSWKVVKRAEELGFTRAWFYDTQLLNADIFVAMGAAAVTTSRIRLGTGVLIPSNRIAPVAASALMSLNALAPGVSISVFPPASPPGAPWGLVRSGSPTCGATSSRCSG